MSNEIPNEVVVGEEVIPAEAINPKDLPKEVVDGEKDPPAIPTTDEEKSAVQKRINAITKEKYELKQKLAEAEARLATQPVDPLNLTPESLEQLVKQEATRLAEEKSFNDRCNKIFEESVAKSPTFAEDINTLNSIGLVHNKDLFDSVVESEAASDILVYLADNLDFAEKLINLPIRSMLKEVAKLEIGFAEGKKPVVKPVSNAPAPIKPVSSRGVISEIDPSKDAAAWVAKRNQELAAKRKGK
jgi:hypothetical protein